MSLSADAIYDINNDLNVIVLGARLSREGETDPKKLDWLREIETAAWRIHGTVCGDAKVKTAAQGS
jgi:hypothetical protein